MSQNSKESVEETPFHVLMASKRPVPELLVSNDALRNDYLSRRYKTLYKDKPQQDMWSSALPAERAMIECCQVNDGKNNNIGGALIKGKEREFVRLATLYCHTAASRGLALAILEKTIQQDKLDATEDEEDVVMEDSAVNDAVVVKSADDADTKPTVAETKQDDKKSNANKDDIGRMGRFLEAGGLANLKQWLMDAMSPVKIVVTKPNTTQTSTSTSSKQQPTTTRVVQTTASPTGALLLPLLSILTDMPFDKQLVMSVKINKQIRKLKKQIDEVTAAKKRVRQDDKKWTDPVAGGLVVNDVMTAVSKLMKTWEERSKSSKSFATQDPFQALREKMKQACDTLKEYEVGNTEKPDFLTKFEEEQRRLKEEEELSKLTVEQRATLERQQEREAMLKMAQQRQSEAKAKIDLLLQKSRQESLKRKAEGMISEVKKQRTARRVRWKDGIENADNARRRNMLEQVHVYSREPDLDEYDEAVKQEEQEDGIPSADNTEGAAVKQEELTE